MGPLELLGKVVEVFERLQIPYLVTGSVASMAYGEPRLTNDIDIVAAVEDHHAGDIVHEFSGEEFFVTEDMISQAIHETGQFNILCPASGLKVDVIIKRKTSFDESRFSRLRRISPAETYQANFAAPEDVIIKKMEYYREGGSEKHLRDITGILLISGTEVDTDYIDSWSEKLGLCKIWDAVKKRIKGTN